MDINKFKVNELNSDLTYKVVGAKVSKTKPPKLLEKLYKYDEHFDNNNNDKLDSGDSMRYYFI